MNVFVNRLTDEHARIVVDAEGFRDRRRKTLEDLSLRLANQVIRTKKEVVLEPMPAHERRVIHYQLQHHPKVKTMSKGEEPNRRIVIMLKS
jgi:spoIIIJ-associated protein